MVVDRAGVAGAVGRLQAELGGAEPLELPEPEELDPEELELGAGSALSPIPTVPVYPADGLPLRLGISTFPARTSCW